MNWQLFCSCSLHSISVWIKINQCHFIWDVTFYQIKVTVRTFEKCGDLQLTYIDNLCSLISVYNDFIYHFITSYLGYPQYNLGHCKNIVKLSFFSIYNYNVSIITCIYSIINIYQGFQDIFGEQRQLLLFTT